MTNHPLYEAFAFYYDSFLRQFLTAGNVLATEIIAERRPKDILEIACGAGASFKMYPEGSHVTAVDLSDEMLERARKRAGTFTGTKITVQKMNAQKLEFPDESFDCVTMPSVLTVVPEPELAISEALRVLRKGGSLIVIAHFAEFSPYKGWYRKSLSDWSKKWLGFRLNLSIEVISERVGARITRIVPINKTCGVLPLSSLVVVEKEGKKEGVQTGV